MAHIVFFAFHVGLPTLSHVLYLDIHSMLAFHLSHSLTNPNNPYLFLHSTQCEDFFFNLFFFPHYLFFFFLVEGIEKVDGVNKCPQCPSQLTRTMALVVIRGNGRGGKYLFDSVISFFFAYGRQRFIVVCKYLVSSIAEKSIRNKQRHLEI